MNQAALELKLKEANEKLKSIDEFLKALTTPPHKVATVLDIAGPNVVLAIDNSIMEFANVPKYNLQAGDIALINMETGMLAGKSLMQKTGAVASVVQRVSDTKVEVDAKGERIHVTCTIPVESGDKVLVDHSNTTVVEKYDALDESYQFLQDTNLGWEEIGGQDEAISALREAIELPYRYPELYVAYGHRPPKGILLSGSPGNGKTLLAQAASTALRNINQGHRSGFFYIKGPELLSKWVGETESTIRAIFTNARRFCQKEGFKPVLFVDEAEAILSKRGSGKSSDMEKTIVPMFLAEMDGMDGHHNPIVLLATNRADRLDEAVVREGRIDRKINVKRPNAEAACSIFDIHLDKRPQFERDLAAIATAAVFDENRVIYNVQSKQGHATFRLSNLVSGAMIAGIVGEATSIAVRRHIATKDTTPRSKSLGLTRADMLQAVETVFHQNLNLNHEIHLTEFCEEHGFDTDNVRLTRAFAAASAV